MKCILLGVQISGKVGDAVSISFAPIYGVRACVYGGKRGKGERREAQSRNGELCVYNVCFGY